jgi:dihydrolipoamide dehydrogenase
MKFHLGHKVVGGSVSGDTVSVVVESLKDKKTINMEADIVLVATGRAPHTSNLGLSAVGIETDRLGRIPVNGKLQSEKHSNIYAVGDVVEGPMLAHKGEEEGIAAVEIICGLPGHVNYFSIPNVVYTHPEIATVGYTEEECKEKGISNLK